MNLKKLFLHNWQAKLICLIVAMAIWYVLRFHVIPSSPLLREIDRRTQTPP